MYKPNPFIREYRTQQWDSGINRDYI
jgi:hypothetical protein